MALWLIYWTKILKLLQGINDKTLINECALFPTSNIQLRLYGFWNMYARFREWKHCKKTNELVFCLFLTFRLTNKVKDLSHNLTKKFALQEFTSFSTTKCRYQQANIFENIQFYEVLGLIFFLLSFVNGNSWNISKTLEELFSVVGL